MQRTTFRLESSSSVDEQIEQFKAKVLLKSQERSEIETKILVDLKPLLLETFGNCEVFTFGSMQNGLALKGSDIDLCVKVGSQGASLYQNKIRATSCGKALQSDGKFGDIEAVAHAKIKVPIVNFVHLPTNTKCDISFDTSLNIEHGHLLQFYIHLHPRFFDVMLLIKYYAKNRGVCDGRLYINSFAWNLLFVNYMQTLERSDGTKIVPSVLEMQADSTPYREVQGCRVDFNPPFHHVDLPDDEKFSHLGLLTGFFTYYKNFSFKESVVCPYLGIPVPQSGISSELSPQIAKHMSNLRTFINQGGNYQHIRLIQDPFNHKHFLVCRTENFPTVTSRIAKGAEMCARQMDEEPQTKSRFLEALLS